LRKVPDGCRASSNADRVVDARAAWRMNQKDGMAKFRQIASWLEHDYPDAAAALLEGLEECFTINRLDIPRSLHRCLATSNIVGNLAGAHVTSPALWRTTRVEPSSCV
jgi:hypothetical protein